MSAENRRFSRAKLKNPKSNHLSLLSSRYKTAAILVDRCMIGQRTTQKELSNRATETQNGGETVFVGK